MLLAEIHGKHSQAIEANEDYLTSAVFGHLRFVNEGSFWRQLFQKAFSVDGSGTTLLLELEAAGAKIEDVCRIEMLFWPGTPYGEPDLMLHFPSNVGRSVVLVIEVKLYSEKSSVGPDDQLCRYFELLRDRSALNKLLNLDLAQTEVGLIYLTERFAAADVLESVQLSKYSDAGRRMFPLQWQDITELLLRMAPARDSLLGEVLDFLRHRQYTHFRGFRDIPAFTRIDSGRFYNTTYFHQISGLPGETEEVVGGFYAK